MSKGSPVIPIRINLIDLARIDAAVRQTNRRRSLAPYTRSSWIMAAIQDKLDHILRSRRSSYNRRHPPPQPLQSPHADQLPLATHA